MIFFNYPQFIVNYIYKNSKMCFLKQPLKKKQTLSPLQDMSDKEKALTILFKIRKTLLLMVRDILIKPQSGKHYQHKDKYAFIDSVF